MKIIQFVTRNCIGGVQVVAASLHRGFLQAGQESHVYYFCDTNEEKLEVSHISFLFKRRPRYIYYPLLMLRLWRVLWREQPDAIIAHTTNTAVPGLFLAALQGIKKRIVVQHNPLNTYTALAREADRLWANIGVYWRNISVAQTVTKTITGYSEEAVRRVRLIHNGIRCPLDSYPGYAPQAFREHLYLPKSAFLVVNIGRLAEQKNQIVLIDMLRDMPDVALAIAGDGPLRDELHHAVKLYGLSERVHFLGGLSAQKTRDLLRAADVFISPSLFEAMPIVILEAMQEGAVILASEIEAHCELLGDAGVLVEPTSAALQQGLRRLINDKNLRKKLSEKARYRANLFSEEKMVQQYLDVLHG